MACKQLSLTYAPRALAAYGTAPTYHQLWIAAVAGCIPAEKAGKRWMIREADLATIASHLFQAAR